MARPRTITDERLTAAAGAVIGRLGPEFTLADVAAEAGVSTGTVAGRFGSKRGLLAAMLRTVTDSVEPRALAVAGGTDDPVAAVTEVLLARYAPLDDPAVAANGLAQLGVDLADAQLRALLARLHEAMAAALAPVLTRAVAAGVLPGAPPVPVAARLLTALADGTALHWSADPAGSLRGRLRADVGAVLTGWSNGQRERGSA